MTCQKRPEKFKDCQVVFGPGGDLICDLEHPLLELCHVSRNILRLPENFQRDTAPCPNGFSCRPVWKSLKNLKYHFINDLICGETKNSICLPDNGEPLTSLHNLLRSFELPKTACRRNPCPGGMTPTIKDGYYRSRKKKSHLTYICLSICLDVLKMLRSCPSWGSFPHTAVAVTEFIEWEDADIGFLDKMFKQYLFFAS